jgi:acyl dehydratase
MAAQHYLRGYHGRRGALVRRVRGDRGRDHRVHRRSKLRRARVRSPHADAEQYDPQPFHVDLKAAKETLFGGLIASGCHAAAMTMRLLVDNYLNASEAMGSAGIDSLRWKQPVRPGDTLTVETEMTGTGWPASA